MTKFSLPVLKDDGQLQAPTLAIQVETAPVAYGQRYWKSVEEAMGGVGQSNPFRPVPQRWTGLLGATF
jgi:hypothetical protein